MHQSPGKRPIVEVVGSHRLIARLWVSATLIGCTASLLPLAIGASLGGVFGDFGTLISSQAIFRGFLAAAAFFVFWTASLYYLFLPLKYVLDLPPEQLATQEHAASRAFVRAFRLPYLLGVSSFCLWAIFGTVLGTYVLADISWRLRWVPMVMFVLLGVAVNVPQIYVHRRLLSSVIGYLQQTCAALADREPPDRRTIGTKLGVGFATTQIFALGLAFMANFIHVERARFEDRIELLGNARQFVAGVLKEQAGSGFENDSLAQMRQVMGNLKLGEGGGALVLHKLTGEVIFNNTTVKPDDAVRVAVADGLGEFGEDYRHGVTFVTLDTSQIGLEFDGRGPYLISLVAPHSEDIQFIVQALIILLLLLGSSIGIAYLISNDLAMPLRALVRRSAKIADGRLDTEIAVISDDEVGELATQTRQTVLGLRRMVGNLKSVVDELAGAAEDIGHATQETNEASTRQLTESEQTARAIAKLRLTTEEIVSQVGALNDSIDTTSSAGFELASTARMVRETAGLLESETTAIGGHTRKLEGSLGAFARAIGSLHGASDETRNAVTKIDRSIGEVGAFARNSEKFSEGVLGRAQEGREAVLQTIEGINRINETVGEAAQIVRELGSRNVKVGQILDVINTVADQTNLLSFNAAIIAAQAGEHGQSFAVVSEEIRKLAEQTSASTGEIASLIADIQRESSRAVSAIERGTAEVSRGTELAAGAEAALNQITESAEESLRRVQGLVEAVDEEQRQSQVLLEVVDQLQEMVAEFVRTESDQRSAGDAIVGAMKSLQELSRRVSRSADEQRKAAEEVSRGISEVQHAMESVITAIQDEAIETEKIERASDRIRKLAESQSAKAGELEKVSARLGDQAEALHREMDGFTL
ncbi:MAG: hypothetical protein KDH09_19215 [Chrysiogenetes bacterium]|nr:hypothetical protein [Chrysiogenetes bacterium]